MRQKIENYIKCLGAALLTAAVALLSGCVDEELPDNRDLDYGYVQFRLLKETQSSPESKADVPELDYLSDASKVKVTLQGAGGQLISQTLVLSAAGKDAAEFGLRSDKLRLLAGEYTIASFTLYDGTDEPLYSGMPDSGNQSLTVVPGGLVSSDLHVSVTPRGKVRFTIVKDMDGLTSAPQTKAREGKEYIFEQIAKLDVSVLREGTVEPVEITGLECSFSIHFEDNGDETDGYQTSTVSCDSLVALEAGKYTVVSYQVYDEDDQLLEAIDSNDDDFTESAFTVGDNMTSDAKVYVTLYESDAYLIDNYALKKIWDALGGPEWSYRGQTYNTGCNWDFNKDPDLWSYQPGVQVHPNGRVAYLDLSGFGIKGEMPKEIGNLSELIELYLGTHSDNAVSVGRSSMGASARQASHFYTPKSAADREAERKGYKDEYISSRYQQYQMSPICALSLRLHGLTSPAASSYDGLTTEELFAAGAKDIDRKDLSAKPMDVAPGVMYNGLISLPAEIGKLKRLEKLSIANSPIKSFGGADFSGLENLTDLEIYNCPNIKEFPDLSTLPKLTTLNLSYIVSDNPESIKEDDVMEAIAKMSTGAASRSLQMFYCNNNGLTAFPKALGDFADLAMVDFSSNEITSLPDMEGKFDPSELYLQNNKIESIENERNFCDADILTTISLANNRLDHVPDLFRPLAGIQMSSIDLSYNRITEFTFPEDLGADGDFAYVVTFNLGGNSIKTFPKDFFNHCEVSYIIMSDCDLEEIPEGTFDAKYTETLISIDMQFNRLKEFPIDFNATSVPYLYGVDVSSNAFTDVPVGFLSCRGLTVLGFRGQRADSGERCFKTWPSLLYQHTGLRAFYAGSNDIRTVTAGQLSPTIFHVEIADNPNIYFDASDICQAWMQGEYNLYYDKSQNIINCEAMLQ